jgi:2-keto-4-pentenoate hydratase/2-oxohepta-3-ene-1,7-dioic acid hydratase in catechol pathway
MKYCTFIRAGEVGYGVLGDTDVWDLSHALCRDYGDLKSLLAAVATGSGPDLRRTLQTAPSLPLETVELLAPIPNPDKIFCVGYNYLSHVEETGKTVPERPFIFTRFADTLVGHGSPLVRPAESTSFDYQGALAVIIGKGGRRIRTEHASSHIAGYSCFNEASLRDWQRHSPTFIAGKNFPCTGAFGPAVVSVDELPDWRAVTIRTRLNGVLVQNEAASKMLVGVEQLISYLSTFTPLHAGDVIVTGTPGGVGACRNPKLWLAPGDVVEVEIDGLGVLRNPITQELPPG